MVIYICLIIQAAGESQLSGSAAACSPVCAPLTYTQTHANLLPRTHTDTHTHSHTHTHTRTHTHGLPRSQEHKAKRLAARSEVLSMARALDAERDGLKAVDAALQYTLVPKVPSSA
jgi:hypothetical protein